MFEGIKQLIENQDLRTQDPWEKEIRELWTNIL